MCFFFLSSLMLKNCRLSKQNSLYSTFEEYYMISVCTARYKRMQEEHVRQRIARDAECQHSQYSQYSFQEHLTGFLILRHLDILAAKRNYFI